MRDTMHDDMTPEEVREAWARMHAKLSPDEREMLSATLSGAEVNHALLYVVGALLLGIVGGWALHGLFS